MRLDEAAELSDYLRFRGKIWKIESGPNANTEYFCRGLVREDEVDGLVNFHDTETLAASEQVTPVKILVEEIK